MKQPGCTAHSVGECVVQATAEDDVGRQWPRRRPVRGLGVHLQRRNHGAGRIIVNVVAEQHHVVLRGQQQRACVAKGGMVSGRTGAVPQCRPTERVTPQHADMMRGVAARGHGGIAQAVRRPMQRRQVPATARSGGGRRGKVVCHPPLVRLGVECRGDELEPRTPRCGTPGDGVPTDGGSERQPPQCNNCPMAASAGPGEMGHPQEHGPGGDGHGEGGGIITRLSSADVNRICSGQVRLGDCCCPH